MNTSKISPDDPRLTAYALGEMEPTEHAEFAQLLSDDPVARATVEEIRAATLALSAALEFEPAPAQSEPPAPPVRGKILRFPALYFVVSGLAAACFAVFFILHESNEAARNELLAKQAVVLDGTRSNDAMVSGSVAVNPPAMQAKAAPAPAALALVPAEFMAEDRFFSTAAAMTSAFPLRVGRESYDAVRALLRKGMRPARETVRVAEMINAFTYTWPEPADNEAFASVLEETEAPWAPEHRLVRVGLKWQGGREYPLANDARVEVDFNPARVLAWRLVGFERAGGMAGVRGTAGESLQPGDAVTVLYELVPVAAVAPDADPNLLRLAVSYRDRSEPERSTFERALPVGGTRFAAASADMRFATAVAAFGLRLRDSALQAPVALTEIEQWARVDGETAERTEFLGLVQAAEQIVR